MAKYSGLSRHLEGLGESEVTLSFDEVSSLVTGGLPKSAYDHRPWWANRHDGRDAQNQGWQSVGWETKDVDMNAQTVTFFQLGSPREASRRPETVRLLTLAEAKAGLAAAFGVGTDAIEITIKG